VECREHCSEGGWSTEIDHSLSSSTSRWHTLAGFSRNYQHPEDKSAVYNSWVAINTSVTSVSQQQQREYYPTETLSAALNLSFADSHYNASRSHKLRFSNDIFHQESGLLRYMGMLVPLSSCEVATCSKMDTFEYIALHIQDPSLDYIPSVQDYNLPSSKHRDLNDSSIPKHIRKGINYDKSDLVVIQPKVSQITSPLVLF
jgi:hypothetical protein